MPTSNAQIRSTFDANAENWTITGNGINNGNANYNAAGGNPGGCATRTDLGPGETWYFVAPAKFHGNKSWAYGGTWRYQMRQSTAANPYSDDDFVVSGGGLTIVYDFPFNGSTTWADFAAPIAEASWRFGSRNGRVVTQAEMLTVLCNITEIRIRGEYSSNLADVGYLDNFILDAPRCLATANLNFSLCNGQNVIVNGRNYTSAGTFQDSISRCYPLCDSIINITIAVGATNTRNRDTSLCAGQSLRVSTRTYTTTGIYRDTFRNQSGCDSIIVTNLTILPPLSRTQNIAICPTQTYTVGNKTYSTAGTYRDTFRNTAGCDSIVLTNLTIQAAFTRTQNLQICQGQNLTIGTRTYTATGSYRDTFRAVSGCDSIVITNLTVNPTYSRSQNLSICQGQTVRVGSKTYTTTGNYRDTLRSISGCDSIILTNLTVNPNATRTQNIRICGGETFTVGSKVYTTTGTYRDTFRTFLNCDSIVTTNLTVTPSVNRLQNRAICNGQTYAVGTRTYTRTGVYRDTFRSFLNCDSIVITDLTVNPTPFRAQQISVCQGQSVRVGTRTYTQTGVYRDTFRSFLNCDSVVETNVTIRPPLRFAQNPSICEGATFRVGSRFYNVMGNYVDTLRTLAGCDSIVTTNLTVIAPSVRNQSFSLCEGDSVRVNNKFYKTAGVFRDILRGSNGCDSIINTTISVTQIGGNVATESALCIANGTATVVATVNVPNSTFTFLWSNGQTEVQATGLTVGTYRVTTTAAGCSKVFVANVGSLPSDLSVDSVAQSPMCYGFKDGKVELRVFGGKRPFTFKWNDNSTDSLKENLGIGTYRVTVTDAKGCTDSVVAVLTQPDSIQFDVAAQTVTCSEKNDGSITLSNVRGGVPTYTYSINGGSQQNTLIFNRLFASAYQVKVRDSIGCEVMKEVELVPPPTLTVFIGRDTTIKLGDSLRLIAALSANPNLPITYAWRPPQYLTCTNCPNPSTRLLTQNTRIAISVTDGRGCVTSDSFMVEIKKNYAVFFPTAFSPNNDGLNDFFGVFTNATVKNVRNFKVFNRWGDLVFAKNELLQNVIADGWDGQMSDKDAPAGVYVFVAEVEFLDGVVERFRGEVILLR